MKAPLQALDSGQVVDLGASVPAQHLAPTPLGVAQEREAQSARDARDVAMRVAEAKFRMRLFARGARAMGVTVEAEWATQDDPAGAAAAALESHISVQIATGIALCGRREGLHGYNTQNWLFHILVTL